MPAAPATTPAKADAAALSVDEQFLELVCGDADLLAAEFDAIIAAEWSDPPARHTGRSGSHRRVPPDDGRRRQTRRANQANRPRHPGVGGWARQRSPPPAPSTDRCQAERQVIATRE
jgi:hypothetical protein